MLLIMVLMYSTAHQKIRKQCFEAFWYTHHLAFFFMIGLYTHATGCFVRDSVDPDYSATFPFYRVGHCLGYESWRFIIWPGILYFGERVWREIRARWPTRLSKVLVHPSGMFLLSSSMLRRDVTDVPDLLLLSLLSLGAMELRIVKPSFKYVAGQWLFIQIPELSKFQWHPVSNHTLFARVKFSKVHLSYLFFGTSSLSLQHLKIPMSQFIFVKLVTGLSHWVNVSVSVLLLLRR